MPGHEPLVRGVGVLADGQDVDVAVTDPSDLKETRIEIRIRIVVNVETIVFNVMLLPLKKFHICFGRWSAVLHS